MASFQLVGDDVLEGIQWGKLGAGIVKGAKAVTNVVGIVSEINRPAPGVVAKQADVIEEKKEEKKQMDMNTVYIAAGVGVLAIAAIAFTMRKKKS